jgi:HD superfamily phosphodiesterase
LKQLKTIIDREKIVVDIIGKETTSEQHTMVKRLQRRKAARSIKKHRDNKSLVMGVTWYHPEQWERLREIVEDKENFDKTYEESVLDSENKIKQLEAQGMRPVKVEVDVEEMLTWCSAQGLSVTPETRTKFMMTKLREMVQNGIVKP